MFARLRQLTELGYRKVRDAFWTSPVARWPVVANLAIRMGYAARRWLGLAPQREQVALVQGHKMWFSPGSECYLDMVRGTWEPGVTRLFGELLEEGMVVIDAGAHVGYFTLLAARSVGPVGRVYAFEPVPTNYDLLVRNIELNGYRNIVPVQKAISSTVGSERFFIHPSTVGHSLFPETSKSQRIINVEVTTLDRFLEGEGWPSVHLVKMDIEGAEPAALEGMTGLLMRNRALRLVLEYVPHILERAGEDPTRFLDRLRGLGFTIRAIGRDRLQELFEMATKNPGLRVELLCERDYR